MLDLQAQMNAKVNPDWIQAKYPFLRAVVVEGAEAMEHHGWKWWKKQACDLPQLQMELVDIWHFALSDIIIQANGDIDRASKLLGEYSVQRREVDFDDEIFVLAHLDALAKIELLIGLAAARRFSVPLFASLMGDCGMDWDTLYLQYVNKNVLNFFRQDHGYKDGRYIKIWDGREDNEHLVEISAGIDVTALDYRDRLYAGLQGRYATVSK
jgi:hypothetical protein